jgi:hypothetical protein
MNQTKREIVPEQRGCNVSMKFNFTVGGVAIAIAFAIGYLVYAYW